ncbi:MAG: helix-turn-helix domain-containing protein [Actinomycetota bacterium]|nr:helix-turn-helix domain-containing protein [Actinomycetota bacterium]
MGSLMMSVVSVASPSGLNIDKVLSCLDGTLSLGYGSPDALIDVGAVTVYDGLDQPDCPDHAIVLGPGLRSRDQVAQALRHLSSRGGASALVVREPLPRCPTISAAAARSGIAVLALAKGESWLRLNAAFEELISDETSVPLQDESFAGIPTGDLFALANAVAALLNAPITIEDRNSRLLAFSGGQDEADQTRVSTILGRRVSVENLQVLETHGVFERLYRSDEPVYVGPPNIPIDGLTVPRVAIAIRAGNEVLGSLWAASAEELTPSRIKDFHDMAKLVALHMLSQRAGSDVRRRLRAEQLETLLDGGPGSRDVAHRLGLLDQPAIVLALAVPDSANGPDASRTAERQLLSDAFAMHLTAAHPHAVASLIGNIAYGILPIPAANGAAQRRALRLSEDFLHRTGGRIHAYIGVGSVSARSSGLASSRLSAERALRVLQLTDCRTRVASISEVYVEALLLELREQIDVRGDAVRGPVSRLAEYDSKHRTCLVKTLQAWLDLFGDVSGAAAAVGVHANTFRYRLRRLAEVANIDLGDANTRFAAMLELRLMTDEA